MAFDHEELKRRRAELAAQRKQEAAQRRALILRLTLAVLVFIGVGVLIYVVSVNGAGIAPTPTEITTAPQETAATDATGTTAAPETEPPEEEELQTVIHFAAAGDLNITDRVIASATADMDFTATFQDIMPLLATADLTALNFEGNLVGTPYGTLHHSAPQTLMTNLANAGVDLIQMANSNAIYNGIIGLQQTLSGIKAAGLEPVGAWGTREEFRKSGGYTIREVKGVRVAIVAFTKGMDSMALPQGSENCVNVLYQDYSTTYRKVDTSGIRSIVRAAKEENPDIIIALVHWGSEYNNQISSSQQTIKSLLLSEGVDAIIGTHPHYVQTIEFDRKNGTFVCFSLGDLISDGVEAGTEYSIIVDLEITKDNQTGDAWISHYTYTPIFTIHDAGEPLRVVRIEEAVAAYKANHVGKVSKETYNDMLYALQRIEARIKGE